jgi:hypothetical protein
MGRNRVSARDATVRRKIDVTRAFAEETPTKPVVPALVPLDSVPELAVARGEVPWEDLGSLATQLVLRVDGSACTMSIVTDVVATPLEAARELATLVARGLVRLVAAPVDEPITLELELSTG